MAAVVSIPGITKPGFWHRKAPLEIAIGTGSTVTTGLGGLKLALSPTPGDFVWGASLLGCTAGVLLIAIWKTAQARKQDADANWKHEHEGINGALHAVHQVAAACTGLETYKDAKLLRVTFHRAVPVVEDGNPTEQVNELEQLANYVGGDGNGIGRKFPVRAGIAGRAFRKKTVVKGDLSDADPDAQRAELVDNWGYTEADLKTLTPNRRSMLAVPVLDTTRQRAIGVVYMDSSQCNVFDSKEVRGMIVAACAGVASFVNERY